jgi:hypothetical protein
VRSGRSAGGGASVASGQRLVSKDKAAREVAALSFAATAPAAREPQVQDENERVEYNPEDQRSVQSSQYSVAEVSLNGFACGAVAQRPTSLQN